jgi:uncharacterized membrane protein YeaQ/YmgE (transglycosylase-associated protein family)
MWGLLAWVLMGAFVGWVVSLITGRDLRGGCLGYVVVGVITMFVLGLLFRLLWVCLVLGALLIAAAWLLEVLRNPDRGE